MSPESTIFCFKCGTQLPASALFCNHCGTQLPAPAMTAAAPVVSAAPAMPAAPIATAAAPARVVAPAVPGAPTYAGFWLRFVAVIIDAILLEFVIIPVSFMLGLVVGAVGASAGPGVDRVAIQVVAGVLGGFAGALIYWIYFAMFESSAKQSTLGKRLLGLYVTDLQGRRISFARATGRHFSKFISTATLLIGYMLAGWTEKKQALHDMIAGTLVLRRS